MPRTLRSLRSCLAAVALVAGFCAPETAHADKVRDLADVAGVRENQLLGYGIVTGLNGTGDDARAPFAAQSVLSMLRRLGVQVDSEQVRLRNVAAVIVTANLPPFAKTGTKLDVTVSSIGNAKSISGGVLVQTLLKGPDQKTYAVAQGTILVGGISAGGKSGSSVSSGNVTSARIPEGAIIEREVKTNFASKGTVKLSLRNPSFGVAARMASAIDAKLGKGTAKAPDGGEVLVTIPDSFKGNSVGLIAELEELDVGVVRRARVVISEGTDTIVAGGDVRLAPVAIVHGALTIVVNETPVVSQPGALSGGETVVLPTSEVKVDQAPSTMHYVPAAATLADVSTALGTLGLSPRELASVLQALRSAGALEAEIVVQ